MLANETRCRTTTKHPEAKSPPRPTTSSLSASPAPLSHTTALGNPPHYPAPLLEIPFVSTFFKGTLVSLSVPAPSPSRHRRRGSGPVPDAQRYDRWGLRPASVLTLSLFLGHPLLTLLIHVGWEGVGTEVTWSGISLVPDAVLGYFPSVCFL